MKNKKEKRLYLSGIFSIFLLASCVSDDKNEIIIPTEINFQITASRDLEEDFPDGLIPWINIENPQIEALVNKDETVIKQNEIVVIIDYPLTNSVEFKISSKNGSGFTRKELISVISEKYHDIYRIEEETAKVKTIPLSERKKIINRNSTDGKYGIWGHDLSDLDLSSIEVSKDSDGKIMVILNIES